MKRKANSGVLVYGLWIVIASILWTCLTGDLWHWLVVVPTLCIGASLLQSIVKGNRK